MLASSIIAFHDGHPGVEPGPALTGRRVDVNIRRAETGVVQRPDPDEAYSLLRRGVMAPNGSFATAAADDILALSAVRGRRDGFDFSLLPRQGRLQYTLRRSILL